MKAFLFFGFCTIFQISIYSQTTVVKEKKWTEEEHKQMDKAELFYSEKNYRLALPIFEKLYKNHPTEMHLKYLYGVCALLIPGKQEVCLQLFKDVYEKNKKAADIDYYLAKANFLNYNFNEAITGVATYKSKNKKLSPDQLKDCDQLVTYCNNAKLLVPHPVSVHIENMGNVINTTAAESAPCLTDDENVIIYTYKGEKSKGGLQNAFNQPNKHGVYYEDVFTSSKINGVWKTPEEIKNLNTNNNEAVLFLSDDGQKLFISMDSQQDDGDIYMSTLDKEVWSAPVKLMGDVNSEYWENNSSLSPDGKTLFFSSSRPGGFGGKDIYKSNLLPDGTWGKAKNLGDKINTPLDEDAPFIHYDSRLLLFCSQGHNSIGGYDIFKSYLNTTDSIWSLAENMGSPINTPGDEIHYVLSPSGDNGYYALGKVDGYGDFDIYKVEPGIDGTMPVVAVSKGKVTLDTMPVEAEIIVEVPARNTIFRTLKSNAQTGIYRITLPVGEDYKITWKLKDSLIQTDVFEAKNASLYTLKEKNINFTTKKDTSHPIVSSNPCNGLSIPDLSRFKGKSLNNQLVYKELLDIVGNFCVEGLVFKVQIGAYKHPENFKFDDLKEFGMPESISYPDGITRFTQFSFSTVNEVEAARKKIIEKGHKDAWIVAFKDGKRLTLEELILLNFFSKAVN